MSTILEEALQANLSANYFDLLKARLESNATHDVKVEEGSAYLFKFIKKGSIFSEQFHHLCEYIISKSVPEVFSVCDQTTNYVPFELALKNIKIQERTLYLLHSNGINFNAFGVAGNSAMVELIAGRINTGLLPVMATLGISLNSVNKNNCTLLHTAAHYGNVEAAKHLLSYGVGINQTSVFGSNALHILLQECPSNLFEMATFLIQNGIDLNAKDSYGKTPIIYAAREAGSNEMHNVIKLLIMSCPESCAKGAERLAFLKALIRSSVTPTQFREIVELLGEKELVKMYDRRGYDKCHREIYWKDELQSCCNIA